MLLLYVKVVTVLRMMICNITTLIFMILELANCMKVYEEIIFSRYCPRNNTCKPPGTHIVCTLFRPQNHAQPNCLRHKPLDLTPMHANLILRRTNKIRAEVASGVAIGNNGLPLPKGFGMFPVKWNAEFAALSKLMLKNGDIKSFFGCAATGAFPTPAITSLSLPVDSNLERFIEKAFDFAESLKQDITKEDILKCPDLKEHPARYYIRLIQGRATEMGCALAECIDKYDFSRLNRLYCYLSTGTPELKPVYNTVPPTPETGLTPNCGCPPGFVDSASCLCGDNSTEVVTSTFTTEVVTSTITTEMVPTTSTAFYPNIVYKASQITASSTAAVEESYMHIGQ